MFNKIYSSVRNVPSLLFLFSLIIPALGFSQASLPTSFTGPNWSSALPTGWSQSGLSDHSSSLDASGNAAIFNATGESLTIYVGSTPQSLTYYIDKTAALGVSDNFIVEESADNSSYSTIVSYTVLSGAANPTYSLNSTSRYIRFRYANKSLVLGTNFLIDGISVTCGTPNTQAASVGFNTVYNLGLSASWTNGNGTARSVFMAAAASGTPAPVDGTTYTANSAFGSGSQIGATGWYCVYSGTGTAVNITGLTASTTYRVMVVETNCSGSSIKYNTTAGSNIANQTTTALCVQPTTQASNFGSNTIGPTSGNITYTRGNGTAGVLVLANAGAPVSTDPTAGVSYTANTVFGTGDAIGSGYVIYKGSASGFTATNLQHSTTYYFAVYEYTNNGYCYKTSPLTGSFTTLTPTLTLSNIPANPISFGNVVTGSSSSAQQYNIQGSNLIANVTVAAPSNFQVSADNNTFGSTATYTKQADNTLGISPQTVYVKFTPNTANGANSDNISAASTGITTQNTTVSGNSLATEPTVASTVTFGAQTPTSLVVNFTGGNGANKIVVVRASAATTFTPSDAIAATGVNANFSSASDQGSGNKIVYDGSGNTVTITGLSANLFYYISVFEYNVGTSTSYNYLTSAFGTNNTYLTDNAMYIPDDMASAVAQNFDALSNVGVSTAMGTGWGYTETGINANSSYTANDGTSTTGDTYSWGPNSSTDRALGTLNDGNLNDLFGAKIINTSGATTTSLLIKYTGEQWRLGTAARLDKLDFQYSTDATSLTTGTWTNFDALDFTAPNTTSSIGALDGNANSNRTLISASITGLAIANYGTIWIRWVDYDATGDDDALGVDEFSFMGFSNTCTTGNTTINTGNLNNLNIVVNGTLQGNTTVNGTLNFESNTALNLNASTLTLNGVINGTTKFTGSLTSSLNIGGSGTIATINMDQTTNGTTNALKDFTINRSGETLTLGDTLAIATNGTVTTTAGTLATGNKLKLLSTLAGTGRIATIGASADVTGLITTQRFINGGPANPMRGWRMMSIPTTSNTFSQFTDDILVTGPGGATNGFDLAGTNSSIRTWVESSTRYWASINNTSNTLAAGKGALVFFRGDRTQTSSLTNTTVAPHDVTVDYIGAINKGNITVNLDFAIDSTPIYGKGYNLLGNPYPSQIEWTNVSKTANVGDWFYVWVPSTQNYTSANSGPIAIGQAFFVNTTQTGQSVTFEENDKVGTSGTAYFKTDPVLTIKMGLDSMQYDIAALHFKTGASSNYLYKEDAAKLSNPVYNLSILTTDSVPTQHNVVSYLQTNSSDTFIIRTLSNKDTAYSLLFSQISNIPVAKNIFLNDKYTNTWVDLRTQANYTFTINNNNSASFGDRFLLVITDQYNPLPIKIKSFSGKRVNQINQLNWTTVSEKNSIGYEIERSVDGTTFEPIGLVKSLNNSSFTNYTFEDALANSPINYYRLKLLDNRGFEYSNTVSITTNSNTTGLDFTEIYPNPAQNSLYINYAASITQGSIKIINLSGVVISELKLCSVIDISKLQQGIYIMVIQTSHQNQSFKFIKQ